MGGFLLEIDVSRGLSEDSGRREVFFARSVSVDEDVHATADREVGVTLSRYSPFLPVTPLD